LLDKRNNREGLFRGGRKTGTVIEEGAERYIRIPGAELDKKRVEAKAKEEGAQRIPLLGASLGANGGGTSE
jgi:hypothetical protein